MIEGVQARMRAIGCRLLDLQAADALAGMGPTRVRGVRIETLGGFRVLRDGQAVPGSAWRSRKARDLLKILVARRGRAVTRDADLYVPPGAARRRAVLAVLAGTTLAAAGLLVGVTALLPGLLAVAVLALVPVAQARVATRPQPVLPPDLTAADNAVRHLATRTLDDAGAGAALLLVAWQASTVGQALPHWWPPLLWGPQLAAFVVAVVWWRRSAPRRLLPDAPDAPDARAGAKAEAVP